jgi:hypothetical protein
MHRPDKVEHGQADDNRTQLRQRNSEKAATAGAIDGTASYSSPDALQARQQVNSCKRVAGPDIDKGDGMQRQLPVSSATDWAMG